MAWPPEPVPTPQCLLDCAMDGDSDYTLEDWTEAFNECWLMSLPALAVDWNRPEEDAGWGYLHDPGETMDSGSTVQP